MKLLQLARGLPGHPTHPPLTDATVGAYTVATALGLADVTGISKNAAAYGWWLALILGLIFTVPTAVTGFVDWLTLTWRSPLWWTATWHMLAMVTATVFFGIAAIIGHGGYTHGDATAGAYALTVIGFAAMTIGGWLGGSIVFVNGMRVLNLVEEPPARAASPLPTPENEAAEGS